MWYEIMRAGGNVNVKEGQALMCAVGCPFYQPRECRNVRVAQLDHVLT